MGSTNPSRTLILVVDDDAYTRRILRLLLEKERYQVQEAGDGELAVELVQSKHPDLVLTDLMMPGMGGIELVKVIRQLPGCHRLPVMMLTAVNEPDTADQSFAAGVTDFFVKPINWPVLRQRIKRLLVAAELEIQTTRSATLSQVFIDQALDAMMTLDQAGIIQTVNLAGVKLFGYEPGCLDGHPIQTLFPGLRVSGLGAPGMIVETNGVQSDNQPVPVEIAINPLNFGENRGFALVIRRRPHSIVSPHLQSEAVPALDDIPWLKERAIQAAQVGFVIVDLRLPGAPLVFANQAFCQLTGYSLAEVFHRNCRFLQGPGTDPEAIEQVRSAIEKREACTVVLKNYRRDKTPFWNQLSIAPIVIPDRPVTHFVGVQTDVTLQKQIAEAYNQINAFLLTIIRTIPSGIAAVNTQGRLTLVNQRLSDITGYPAEDLLGKPLTGLFAVPGQVELLLRRSRSGVTELKVLEQELDLLHDHRPPVFVRLRMATFAAEGITVAVIEDLSEREHTQALIKQAELEWLATVDAVSDLIVLEDDARKLRRCNWAVVQFFERRFDDLIGEDLCTLFSFPELESPGDLTVNTWHPLRVPIAEVQFANRKGWFEITNYQVSTEPEFRLGWVHIIKNITFRKQAEADVLRLNAAIEQAADAIVLTDISGTIVYANPAFEKTTGYRHEDALGRQLFQLHRQVLKEEVFHGGPVDSGWQGQYTTTRQDGSTYAEDISVSPIKNQAGETINFVAVFRDVSEKNRLESIAEAVNMMDNVGFIFSGIRHELGNPINSIKVSLAVLRQNLELAPRLELEKYRNQSLSLYKIVLKS